MSHLEIDDHISGGIVGISRRGTQKELGDPSVKIEEDEVAGLDVIRI